MQPTPQPPFAAARPFTPFPKLARLSRECVITEKLDGTNAAVVITDERDIYAQSRNRVITPEADNMGFAKWVRDHADELRNLGPGTHFGEWWGAGIQRKYNTGEKRFSLFNVGRWASANPNASQGMTVADYVERGLCFAPACCHVVPVLARGMFSDGIVDACMMHLRTFGSVAAPGFMNPEGIVIYHTAAQTMFKKTIEGDESPKSLAAARA